MNAAQLKEFLIQRGVSELDAIKIQGRHFIEHFIFYKLMLIIHFEY